tara:strand:- start:1052 stop:1306 length:255 start_codon:yes stop_codon:yes gene_type:complete
MTLTQIQMKTIYDWNFSRDISLFSNWTQGKAIDLAMFCKDYAKSFTTNHQFWGITVGNGSPAKMNKSVLLTLSSDLIDFKSDIL